MLIWNRSAIFRIQYPISCSA